MTKLFYIISNDFEWYNKFIEKFNMILYEFNKQSALYQVKIRINSKFEWEEKCKRKFKKDRNKVIREYTKDRRKISSMRMSSDRHVNEDH